MGLFSLPNPAGTRALPSGLLELDSRSNTLIVPGEYEVPVPTTDAAAVALGWPSLAAAVDGDMWLCDEAAGNLVGKVRGYQLAPQNAPLQNRDFNGLPYGGNLWGKKAVETLGNSGNDRFTAAAGAGVLDIGAGVDFTISLLLRPRSVAPAVAEEFVRKLLGVTGWDIYCGVAGQPVIRWNDGGWFSSALAVNVYDGALHLLTASADRDGNFSWYLDGNATVAVAATRPGDLTNGDIFTLLNYGTAGGNAFNGQCAWAWFCIGAACDRTGHDAMWARLSSSNLGTPNSYARTNPLTVPISASRVATYAAGQVAIGYNANAVVADNALGTGVVAEDGATFLGISSNNLVASGAAGGWTNSNTTGAQIDGPSGMRDAIRVTMLANFLAGAGGNYLYNQSVTPLVGASNVAFAFGARYKRGANGTTARAALDFRNDPGGSEVFTIISDAATPVDWAAYAASCTPTRPAQTAMYVQLGAALNGNDCDFAEPYCVQNRAVDVLAHRRTAAVSAATSTPTLSYTNVANARYSPARGRLRVRVANFQGTSGAFFFTFGAAGTAGAMTLSYNAGALILRIWDDVAALVCTLSCGAVNTADHTYTVEWDAAIGKAAVFEGATVLDSFGGTWTPEPLAVAPLYVGCDNLGTSAARCLIELLTGFNY